MTFFAGASDIKISGGTFMSVNNSGTFVNNINSNNVVDSYNTHSTAMYDSGNNNSRQYNGSGSHIRNDDPPPQRRNYPPPPAVPDWSRTAAQRGGYGGGGGPGYGYGGGGGGSYPPPPPGGGGQTYNSFNTRNEVYDGSYNDNSRRYGAPSPGDRGPNMNMNTNMKKRPEKAADEPWMDDDRDDFMGGPSRNPKAGARRPSPSAHYAPYGEPPRRSPAAAVPGGMARGGFGGGFGGGGLEGRGGGGGARMMNIPDMHVRSPGGGHMSVQDAQIAQMNPESRKHFKALFRSLNGEQASDSEESEEEVQEQDKRMAGSGPPRTLSAGIANMRLDDADGGPAAEAGPSRVGTKSAPPLHEDDQDEEMDGAPQTGPPRPTFHGASAASADDVPKKKKKGGRKRSPPGHSPSSSDQRDFWDYPASHQGYPNYPSHPGQSPPPGAYSYGEGPGRGMAYAPHPPPPPPGHYGRGGAYPDPHFQQHYAFGNNYGHPGSNLPYTGPAYGAPPPMGYQGNGNVHNVHMENAYNDNSHVEYRDEADEEVGEVAEQQKGKGKRKDKEYDEPISAKKLTKKKDAAAPVAVE